MTPTRSERVRLGPRIAGTYVNMAMGCITYGDPLDFGVDEHPVATYFDVHQGYRVLTQNHMCAAHCRSGTVARSLTQTDLGTHCRNMGVLGNLVE